MLEGTGTALLGVDDQHMGEVLSLCRSPGSLARKWSGVQFARADLIRSALKLLDDGEAWVHIWRGRGCQHSAVPG